MWWACIDAGTLPKHRTARGALSHNFASRHSKMMLLSAIAAVLLAVVAKRRIGAARPKYRARAHTPQEAHAEAHEAPPAAGRTTATIIADYDLDAENASETIDAAEVDEVFGGHLPPDVKQVINSLGGRNLRILPQCEDGTYLSGIYDRGDDNYARALATAIADENIVVMNCISRTAGRSRVVRIAGARRRCSPPASRAKQRLPNIYWRAARISRRKQRWMGSRIARRVCT